MLDILGKLAGALLPVACLVLLYQIWAALAGEEAHPGRTLIAIATLFVLAMFAKPERQ